VNVRRLRRGMDKNLLRDQTFISYWSHLRGAPQTSQMVDVFL
jgi:hypothetical protein